MTSRFLGLLRRPVGEGQSPQSPSNVGNVPSSNRSSRPRSALSLLSILFGLCALTAIEARAASTKPIDDLPGWQHRRWSVQDGAPGQVKGIVQTPDGYIWIGGVTGLYRFNGSTFRRMTLLGGAGQAEAVHSLVALRDGSVWVAHDYGGVSVLRAGTWRPVPAMGRNSVRLLKVGNDEVWSVLQTGGEFILHQWHGGKVSVRIVPFDESRWVTNIMAIGGDRTIWILSERRLIHMAVGDQAFKEDMVVPEDVNFTTDGSGGVWLITKNGIQSLSLASGGKATAGPFINLMPMDTATRIQFDGRGALWQFSERKGVLRYSLSGSPPKAAYLGAVGSVAISGWGRPALIDRERNLWVGGKLGVDQLRPVAFSQVALTSKITGEQESSVALVRDGSGRVFAQQDESLFALDGTAPRRLPYQVFLDDVPCPGSGAGVWIRKGDQALLVDGKTSQTRRLAPSRPPFFFFDGCAEDGDGRLWVSGMGGELGYSTPAGTFAFVHLSARGDTPYAIISDLKGNVLPYVGRGSLWRSNGTSFSELWKANDVTVGAADFLYQGSSYMFLGGPKGLARFDGRRFQTVTPKQLPFIAFISGMVQTARGETWLQNADSVVRLSTADLDRAFSEPGFIPRFHRFNTDDGLPGVSEYFNRSSVVEDRDGRVWVGTNSGLAWANPAEMPLNLVRPQAVIEAIRSGTLSFEASPRVALPTGASRLEVEYSGLSFTLPSRNRYRYRLRGVDADWIDAGNQRLAVYNNLAPGEYVFEVLAANNDGLWSAAPAKVEVIIPPTFLQSIWFKLLLLLSIAGAVALLHRYRLRRVARSMAGRYEERLAERIRIARELHDTLLQGVQGLALRLRVVADRLQPGSETRELVENTLERAEDAIVEGRERILDLRDTSPARLEEIFDEASSQLSSQALEVRSSVLSSSEMLDPLVATELERMIREALVNVERHAEASRVELLGRFERGRVVISIRDNGRGIVPADEEKGAESRFGLVGLKERAASLGGRAWLESTPGKGTAVFIEVPSMKNASRLRARWFHHRN